MAVVGYKCFSMSLTEFAPVVALVMLDVGWAGGAVAWSRRAKSSFDFVQGP